LIIVDASLAATRPGSSTRRGLRFIEHGTGGAVVLNSSAATDPGSVLR
jgi:hypothetical protein